MLLAAVGIIAGLHTRLDLRLVISRPVDPASVTPARVSAHHLEAGPTGTRLAAATEDARCVASEESLEGGDRSGQDADVDLDNRLGGALACEAVTGTPDK